MIGVLIRRENWPHKETSGCMYTEKEPYEDTRQSGYLETKKRGLRRHKPCELLDFRLPASKTVRK